MSASAAEPAVTLDTRGKLCPLPIIELARHIGDVSVGDVIAVVSDDPAARADVAAWCRMRGHTYVGDVAAEDAVAYLVRRAQ